MDPVAELGSEDAVDQLVLRDPIQARERGAGHDRLEVLAVSGDVGHRPGNLSLDPALQLIR